MTLLMLMQDLTKMLVLIKVYNLMPLVVWIIYGNPASLLIMTHSQSISFPDDDMTFTVQVTDSNGCIILMM